MYLKAMLAKLAMLGTPKLCLAMFANLLSYVGFT